MNKNKQGFVSVEYIIVACICLMAFVVFGTAFTSGNDARYGAVIAESSDTNAPIANPTVLPEYTKSNCFVMGAPHVITDYDATCGASVNIPRSIDGMDILYIDDNAFLSKGIANLQIPDGVLTIGVNAFMNNSIKSVILPNSIQSIADSAFAGNRIESLYIPNTLTYMGPQAFNNNLLSPADAFIYEYTIAGINESKIVSYGGANKNITLPYGVTEISSFAFDGAGLESVTLLNLVNTIGIDAFANNFLTRVEFKGVLPTVLGTGIFSGNPGLSMATIKVPSAELSKYQAVAVSNFWVMSDVFY